MGSKASGWLAKALATDRQQVVARLCVRRPTRATEPNKSACPCRCLLRTRAGLVTAARIAESITSASRIASNGGTAFPICRYAEFIAPQKRKPSGND